MYYNHCEIETPPDDTIIWRYMDIEKLLFILENSELFFSRSDKFKDKFEGILPEKNKDQITNPVNKKGVVANSISLRKHCHVNCWHMNDVESVGMWSFYTSKDRGVAIQTTIKGFKSAFIGAAEEIIIGSVSYIDYDNDLIKEDSMFATCFYKRKNFSYEQEVRAFTSTMQNCSLNVNGGYDLENETVSQGINIKIDILSLFGNIHVAPNAPTWFYDLVKSILKKYGYPSVEVKKSDIYNNPAF